ncbi:MAG: hypothetical protein WBG46_03475 [Nonlabens sp.]
MRCILLLILLITCNSINAQLSLESINIKYGSEITEKRGNLIKIGGIANGKIYAVARKKRDYYVQSFDAITLDFLESKKIDIDKSGRTMIEVEDIQIINGRPIVFLNYLKRVLKQDIFAAFSIANNLELIEERELLIIEDRVFSNRADFMFQISDDKSFYTVAYVVADDKKKIISHHVTTVNSAMEELFTDRFDYSIEDDEYYRFDDFTVTNQGDTFLYSSTKTINGGSGSGTTKIDVKSYTNGSEYKPKSYNTEINDLAIDRSKLVLKENTLNILGLYSGLDKDGYKERNIKGYYSLNFDMKQDKFQTPVIQPFSEQLKKQLLGTEKYEDGDEIYTSYRIPKVIRKNDGGLILVIENYLTNTLQLYGNMMVSENTYYYAGTVVLLELDSTGHLEWQIVVPKKQQVKVDNYKVKKPAIPRYGDYKINGGIDYPLGLMNYGVEYLSIVPFYKDGTVSLLFNDHFKNKGVTRFEELKLASNIKKMMPSVFHIDLSSKILIREDPESYEKNQIKIRPSVYYKISDSKYLISLSHKKEKRLGVLELVD